MVLLRERTRPGLGIMEPCLPSSAEAHLPAPPGSTRSSTTASAFCQGKTRQAYRLIARAGNDFSSGSPYHNGREQAPGSLMLDGQRGYRLRRERLRSEERRVGKECRSRWAV